jgi:alpha-galactosidase
MPAAELRPLGTAQTLVDLGDGDTSFVVDAAIGAGTLVHWGAPLGDDDLAATAAALTMPPVVGSLDAVAPVALVPEHGSGFPGRPGLGGRRSDGRAWSPRFVAESVTSGDGSLVIESVDAVAALRLITSLERQRGGAIRIAVELVNAGDDEYWLDDLTVTLALPPHVAELLTFHGRWCRELHPRRRLLDDGPFLAENRRGRTSHENPPLLFAGTAGYGEQRGEVWGAHLAWSGNLRVHAVRLPDGRAMVQLGELLHPGEVVLAPAVAIDRLLCSPCIRRVGSAPPAGSSTPSCVRRRHTASGRGRWY